MSDGSVSGRVSARTGILGPGISISSVSPASYNVVPAMSASGLDILDPGIYWSMPVLVGPSHAPGTVHLLQCGTMLHRGSSSEGAVLMLSWSNNGSNMA